jgi:hypothetical protein
MKQKIECSKKLAWFSGVCFAVSVIYSILIFTYGVYTSSMCDFTLPITLITVTGAVFGVTMVAYNSKSRYENVTKIQKDFLREKYNILQEMGVLDYDRAVTEIEEEFADIDANADNEKNLANQEIIYNG